MIDQGEKLSESALKRLLQDVRRQSTSALAGSAHAVSDDELFSFASGWFEANDRHRVREHLDQCATCSSRLGTFERFAKAWEGPAGQSRLQLLRKKILHTRQAQQEMVFPNGKTSSSSGDRRDDTVDTAAVSNTTVGPHEEILRILNGAGAIERNCDYALPDGLHTDVHVNLAKVCRGERDLNAIVTALDRLTSKERFDTIVSTSWVLGTIARRLVWRLRSQRHLRIQHVRIEGYDPPNLLDEVPENAEVVLLVDVVVTGRQVARTRATLQALNVRSVKAFAIVDADFLGKAPVALDGRLCTVSMDMLAPADCKRHDHMPLMEFNPVAGRMTKKRKPRSPSQFLAKYRTARELWELVDTASAYEHHRIVGKRHYVPFIDTHLLLKDKETGPRVVEKLCRTVERKSGVPDVVLVPKTAKATLLGQRLVAGFEDLFNVAGIRLQSIRHAGSKEIKGLSKANVLVADVVTAHGDTLDELALLSQSAGAHQVAAAVVLSRMSEACESALRRRLNGHFVKLYSLPIRPVTVRSADRRNCFLCRSKQAAGKDSQAGRSARPKTPVRQHSLSLAPLIDYRSGVISGITLHALNAAKNNGMAPLSLPEIISNEYTSAKKAALVRYLPPGTLRWSGPQFRDQLLESLRRGDRTLWLAVVEYLEREQCPDWIDCLPSVIDDPSVRKDWMDDKFWKEISSVARRLARARTDIADRIRSTLEGLAIKYLQSPEGLRFQKILADIQGDATQLDPQA